MEPSIKTHRFKNKQQKLHFVKQQNTSNKGIQHYDFISKQKKTDRDSRLGTCSRPHLCKLLGFPVTAITTVFVTAFTWCTTCTSLCFRLFHILGNKKQTGFQSAIWIKGSLSDRETLHYTRVKICACCLFHKSVPNDKHSNATLH